MKKNVITKLMKEQGLTQTALGEKLGVTQVMVGHWLNGRKSISVARARQIAHILGVTLPEIVKD